MQPVRLIAICTVFIVSTSVLHAEMRTWTDAFGRKIEAELAENMHGNITLRMESGKEAHVGISDLSADDQKYVLKNSPPKIDILVSEVTDRKNKGFSFEHPNNSAFDRDVQIQSTSSEYKITLKKSSRIPYNKAIHAEFYLIGFKKQAEEFVLLDKTVERVDFNQDSSADKFIFNSDSVAVKNLQGGRDKGTELFGHLVVLVDDKNRVFNTRGSRSKIEEHTARIRKRKEGDSVKKGELQSADNRLK